MKATDNFSKQNIIGHGTMGAIYRPKFENGSPYMVKRLQDTQHSKEEWMSEMVTLGSVKHSDIVPLLGFWHCLEAEAFGLPSIWQTLLYTINCIRKKMAVALWNGLGRSELP